MAVFPEYGHRRCSDLHRCVKNCIVPYCAVLGHFQPKFMNQQIRCKEFLFFITTGDMRVQMYLKGNIKSLLLLPPRFIVFDTQFFSFERRTQITFWTLLNLVQCFMTDCFLLWPLVFFCEPHSYFHFLGTL